MVPSSRAPDRTIAPQDLRAAIVDVEGVDAKGRYRKATRLAAARRPSDDDHPRSIHAWSPRLECRVRVGQHVRRQLGRHEVPFGIDDSKSFEPRPRGGEPRGGELHQASVPFRSVLVTIEMEVVEPRSGDRRGVIRVRGHAPSMPDSFVNGQKLGMTTGGKS